MVLAGSPRLLLLDEPSVGLAPDDISRLVTLLTGLPETVTVVLVEHRLDLVYRLADTITVLDLGQHVITGPTPTVRNDPAAQQTYLKPNPRPGGRNPSKPTDKRKPVLRVRDLRAGYHGADVLTGLDLDCTSGEVHAILGLNGAGKSTLLNTIAGLHPRRAGHIELPGPVDRPPQVTGPAAIAIVPQGRRLFTGLTGREHLALAARQHRAPASRVQEVLALMPGLHEHLTRPCTQLSGGQQQMLAIARALLAQPRLLLLDEPTDGLAPQVLTDLSTLLSGLAADGTAILLAEQNHTFALDLADQVTVLHDGRVRYTSDTATLVTPAGQNRLAALLTLTSGASA
jgi:branched-chain amino acid transport system ATP-binding protein